ncbi:uncharacterized protein BO87DRAFT_350024 [Aspergillus neoniger CBS 115656]|uniref:DNA replication checkpoint mediator MRC1 domain-containing protein n=1 Tax=Aspergillus neoniger (strain CBS 115656) TaxID=1448310 RepID=A0A318Z158_ASPNB|nr:hypothetical protein BO87DRAFT_350024 [Aspergillus neoniger CBS 115656]PYH38673.1 hypothetical protein BO87DRAFT_350024 [Aspergillus neoniger CBS 115656]
MSSTPSTPRTTRTASRANSPDAANNDNMMLTPGRKIKAMMAAFDSDSESENDVQAQQKPDRSTTTLSNALKHSTISTQPTNLADSDDDDSEDDEDIVMPKGRMAARLQGQTQNQSEGQTAFDRVSKTLRTEKKDDVDVVMDDEDEDEDDLPTAGPRRRGRNTTDLDPEVEMDPPSPARSESPLFVSSPGRGQDDEDDEDEAGSGNEGEAQPKANSRFLALVAQKRKEREEKEKAEAEKRAARAKQQEQFSQEILSGSESEGDNGSGRKLTQQASRPARKASKKALEEMNRETQRMSRNMQLAHQAQTKKKITKESFFARFNGVKSDERTAPGAPGENSSTADSLNSSDAEAQKEKETPRTSPVLGPVEKEAGEGLGKEAETEFRPLEDILENPRPQPEQPVVARMEIDEAHTTQPGKTPSKKERKLLSGPPVRVRLTREEVARQQKDDSDSELEIVTSPAKCRRIAAFENVPARKAQEPASMMKLKALAHITSPTRKSAMHPAQLSATVLLKAKQQAARERQQRIEELKAKGIHIETAEERAAMEDELENLVEKARKEAEDIAKIERKAAKGAEEDDEDWDYSGSEEEDEEDEDEEENDEDKPAVEDGLVDSEAGEGDESEDDQTETMSVDENDAPTQRRKRPTRVVLDDDDDDDEETDPKTPAKSIVTPTTRSVERPQLPTQSSSNLMSLTQAFAGTISGSHQDNAQSGSTVPYSAPDPDPMNEDRQASDSQTIIRDSQEPRKGSVDLLAGYAQSDSRISESPAPRSTQLSEMPDPTQDAGFVFSPFDPNKRFLGTPQSTIDTVVINRDNQDGSPAPARRMKQLKRGQTADLSMIEEQEENGNEGDFEIDASAFDVMKKATKKPAVPFDRKKSKAKEIVEEAAEESDDEYAGLGGASDEDDDEAENAYDRQMINDNSGETVDEKQLAALNALHQRTNDEKQVAKLLKDITTGALRRRRNADDEFDLDDSDDELLARRREKQREFARMRKALLADEKIGEIAENPKKAAFFRAVEDRDDDDDDVGFDFLDEPQESTQTDDPSSQDNNNTTPQPNDTVTNNRKRPLDHTTDPSDPQSLPPRPPPPLRRTKPVSAMSKKPATLAEIRETLSFLTETHDYDSFHEDASIDMDDMDVDMDMENDTDEDGDDPLSTAAHQQDGAQEQQPKDQQHQQQPLPASQRQHPRRTRGPVVDRLALLRQASSNSANTNSSTTTNSSGGTVPAPGGNRMAFHSGSSGAAELSGFARPPPLVRRSTASSTGSSTSIGSMSSRTSKGTGSSSSTSKSGNVSSSGKGGGKSGAVNYYTAARERERERQLRVQERGGREGNMKALVEKHARNRLGALGKGQWE